MTQSAFLRLVMFLSPSFPTGAFAYSSGLEQASAEGWVHDATTLAAWLEAQVTSGSPWNDAVLLIAAHRQVSDTKALADTAVLAGVLAGSLERHQETINLGRAFTEAVKASGLPCPALPDSVAYPVAIGAVAAANGIEAEAAVAAFLHSFVSNQIQCSIRLGATGQTGGVALLAGLEMLIAHTAARAAQSTLDDLGSNTLMAEIAAMRHETLTSRIFRT